MEYIRRFSFPFLLIILTSAISFLNYTPGTFLTGWDTLHPELNFSQSFSNIFFGVFRTDQGLGAVAAHAHMADLPRIILLWVFSFVLPLSFLRYAIVFLCLILGPLGVYFFIRKVLSIQYPVSSKILNTQYRILNTEVSAFLGALVYLFNLGTVQHFYVPFEMFLVQYASLGWLFLFAAKFIEKRSLKIFMLFALATFLASAMAYASVLWYTYFTAFLLFLGTIFLIKRSKKVFLSSLFLIIVTLTVNSYWILPNIYFLTHAANQVSLAEVNKLFSDEAFLHNKEYGNIFDAAILRNFLFNWTQTIDINTSEDLMIYWKAHLLGPAVLAIGYAVALASAAGIIISIARRSVSGIATIPVFILAFIMLINMNPPFEGIFSYLRDNFPLFREGMRFPFTKFSILLMFSLSVFFAISCSEIFRMLEKLRAKYTKPIFSFGFAVIAGACLFWYGAPVFTGKLIDPKLRINIPERYFALFDYMKGKPSHSRIATLPVHSPWGWEYYDWPARQSLGVGGGYQGAGFLWFGLNQPVLARDFDRWNPDNEQYYREMSSAIYSRDVRQIEALSRKYRISYFLLDESIFSPGNKPNSLWHYETKDTFAKALNIKLEKQFGNLYLYKVDSSLGTSFIQAPFNLTFVGPAVTGGFVDLAAQNHGDYIYSDTPDFTYFSRSLVDRYDRVDPANISILNDLLLLRMGKNKGYNLTDSWKSNDIFPEFMRESYDLTIEKQGLPFIIDDEQFISFPLTAVPANIASSLERSEHCIETSEKSVSEIKKSENLVTFRAKDAASCGFIRFPSAKQDFGSMVIVEARNQKGLPIRLCISENITNRCGIYTPLDSGNAFKKYVFMIPPQPSGASGYAVHFNTLGIGNEESLNEVRYVQFIQIPYYRIASLSFIKEGYTPKTNSALITESNEINPSLYQTQVSFKDDGEGLIALFKAYDPGWSAYEVKVSCKWSDVSCWPTLALPFLFGDEIKVHVELNSWANGWLLPKSSIVNGQSSIVIVYLPQYLEYAGFAILVLTFLFFPLRFFYSTILKKNKHSPAAQNQS